MRIGLAQQDLHRTGEFLNKVSHPKSSDYGKHWTAEQVANAFAASDDTVAAVKEWLIHNDISVDRLLHHRNNWLELNITAKDAERLLRTEYFVHVNKADGRLKAACKEYHVPEVLRGHIDFITPTVHFDTNIERRTKRKEPRSAPKNGRKGGCGYAPTFRSCPTCAPGTNAGDPKTYLGDCANRVTPACVRALYGIPDPSTIQKMDSKGRIPVGIVEFAPASQFPTDLDDFFSVYTDVPCGTHPRTISINGSLPYADLNTPANLFEANGDFEISWAIVYPNEVALYEIGSFETLLDALDGSYCTSAGGDPTMTPQQCGSAATSHFPDVISISWTQAETGHTSAYLQRQCNEFGKLGMMGVTVLAASGDAGVGNNCTNPSTGQNSLTSPGLFQVNYPASCPYVTAVGATRVSKFTPFAPGVQEVAPLDTIISGGGFSNVFAAPDWQLPTMQAYHSNHGSQIVGAGGQSLYNNSGLARGYPDISANGYQYSVYSGETNQPFSGTSGSSPMVAGVISLINGQRLAQKKRTVGFINPVLYAHPEILNDVVRGSNPGCNTTGFGTEKGWDPVTGLGTPNFPAMAALWNSLR
jgi:tripeptidyl-peptidase-1